MPLSTSSFPASRNTTIETVRVLRAALAKLGAPEDLLQVVARPSIPAAKALMAACDLTIATGGPAMVKAAYSSGKPAFGVGAGNATMVIDETANIEEVGHVIARTEKVDMLGKLMLSTQVLKFAPLWSVSND